MLIAGVILNQQSAISNQQSPASTCSRSQGTETGGQRAAEGARPLSGSGARSVGARHRPRRRARCQRDSARNRRRCRRAQVAGPGRHVESRFHRRAHFNIEALARGRCPVRRRGGGGEPGARHVDGAIRRARRRQAGARAGRRSGRNRRRHSRCRIRPSRIHPPALTGNEASPQTAG